MSEDFYLNRAAEQVRENAGRLHVQTFFDEPTFTATHVVHDPGTHKAAIIDQCQSHHRHRCREIFQLHICS